jgi:hypothetical protein
MQINAILEILGALVGVVFIYVNAKNSRSLTGSFFKKYYKLVIVGSIFLVLGFTTDITGDWLGMSEDLIGPLHHLELLIFGIIFVYAAKVLPEEAAKHMEKKI